MRTRLVCSACPTALAGMSNAARKVTVTIAPWTLMGGGLDRLPTGSPGWLIHSSPSRRWSALESGGFNGRSPCSIMRRDGLGLALAFRAIPLPPRAIEDQWLRRTPLSLHSIREMDQIGQRRSPHFRHHLGPVGFYCALRHI